ncbi:L,D-transpeptidase family protein [Myroides sp. M-43]|uniref:L,D-transpeptidase family protein n=1 Tax=Myroides oncorhynchi TaxID=2893756 RepID=UPI001E5883ED|nr:L,D-transpeptidase family protein [Myroides oncorhynchi]MCC9042549.1 L,D-transpeptidase family protein [Myroides oncorhynchi]
MKQLTFCFLSLIILTSCKKFNSFTQTLILNDSIQVTAIEDEALLLIDSLSITTLPKEIQKFYTENLYQIGWSKSINREQLLNTLDLAYLDGINNKKYNTTEIHNYHDNYLTLSDKDKIQADFLFTKAYFRASNDLYNGVLNPRKLYNDWDMFPKEINTAATMLLALNRESINETFDSLRSPNKMYTDLRRKLKEYYILSQDTLKVITNKHPNINDTIPELVNIKKHLRFINYYPDSLAADYINNPLVISSIKKLQKKSKLIENGIVDKKTLDAILKEEDYIKEKIIVNLERWRWFPRNLGENYILVNIADFSLVAVKDGDTIKQHKVVVGKNARKTPILTSVLKTVVINPTWTVPPTILKNDLTPKASANLSYFSNARFTIYEKSTGKVVSPENWDSSKASSYRYVQKAGVGNTLGRIKFMFDNNHAVYLHDTPNKTNFSKTQRNLSSGCIRVEDPFDLAQFIFDVQENEITKEEITKILDSQNTKNISTNKTQIGIHQLYWTLQVEPKGKTTVIGDVYGYDNDLYKKLQ